MRTAIEHEQEEVDSEITLSATTLLGIFFGLVLICGVFFGFGYSTGRRGSETPVNTSSTSVIEPASPPISHTSKPSAMETLQPAGTTPDSNTITESLDQDSTPDAAPSQSAPTVKQAAVTAAPVPKPQAAIPQAKPVSMPAPSGIGTFMVQIAAVTRPEDANALATALRQHGYNVVVRNEPHDQLLHVQVGPFATRDDAKAMRAKLIADGYNAILKP